jgi:hypothetical protein
MDAMRGRSVYCRDRMNNESLIAGCWSLVTSQLPGDEYLATSDSFFLTFRASMLP